MKGTIGFLKVCLCISIGCPAFAQAPPTNDNYSDRTILSGTDITFSGTLAGATEENGEQALTYQSLMGSGTKSVWWAWTAPATETLTLQILGSAREQLQDQPADGLFVYYPTNNSVAPDNLVAIPMGAALSHFRLAPISLSIPVDAGSNYVFQLLGTSSASYTLRLLAANTPVIIQQPRSRTVSSNASALFYVISAGTNQLGFAYQWRRNGNDLSGETAPMLALTNVDSTMAGDYTVVVRDGGNSVVSTVATLGISQSNMPTLLASIGTTTNLFQFSLTGENGRNYRILSSSNLIDWNAEMSFSKTPYWPGSTSVIFNSNSPSVLSVTNHDGWRFFRATPYTPVDADAEICVNNLRQIRVAKMLWARDWVEIERLGGYDWPLPINPAVTPSPEELIPYFPHQVGSGCPSDPFHLHDYYLSYSTRDLLNDPKCLFQTSKHVLEDPL